MVDRSDFQASVLYYAGGTYAASTFLGDAGMNIAEVVNVARDIAERWLPSDVVIEGDTPEEKLASLVEQGTDLLMATGWAIGAVGAAVWRRMQIVGLAVLAALSGEALRQAYAVEEPLDTMNRAATMLQGVSFTAASLGLAGMAKGGIGKVIKGRMQRLRRA